MLNKTNVFVICTGMSDPDQIKQLQQELDVLYQQVKTQEQKIVQLHQQLQQLKGKGFQTFLPQGVQNRSRQWNLENFIGLRLIHFIGIVVLVIGLSISVKYAIDRNLISEGLRIALAYAAGAVLLVLAWRLKKNYNLFSALLFSGAMASFYFTTYAAYVYYAMLPSLATFAVMVAFTIFTAYQAIAYNRQEIAILGLVGAYAIPFLISSNSDRADLLFSYMALINTAVVFLSYKKSWRLVGYLAQNITWLILLGWALQRAGGHQWTGMLFGLLFFVLFCSNALAPAFSGTVLTKERQQDVVINNIALFLLAHILFASNFSDEQVAIVSILFSLFTAVQAAALYFFLKEETRLKMMLALMSLGLFILFIVATWDGITVTLLWLVVAVALFAWGIGGKATWLRLAGMILMGITLLKLVLFDSLRFTPVQKIIAYLTLGVLLLLVGFFYQKFREKLFGTPKE